MKVGDVATPCFLLDLDRLESNIKQMADACRDRKIELWPMVKTHKSTTIAKLQAMHGAKGFLTGTLDEAEGLVAAGMTNIMLAYPVAGEPNVRRVAELARRASLTIGLDGPAAAAQLAQALAAANATIDYLIIIDCGLGRFGVPPTQAAALARELTGLDRLRFKGISTHPGQAYAATNRTELEQVGRQEMEQLALAKQLLEQAGFAVTTVATGSTPTAAAEIASGVVTVLRPGNYVFNDQIQIALGVAAENACSLAVQATVVSHPRPDLFIVNAGSKCLGLDKGGHGTSLIQGFGLVVGHPELRITALSEEVGKIQTEADSSLQVGDLVRIIPNHACSAANMTSFLVGHRQGIVEKLVPIDLRGGMRPPVDHV